MRRHRRAAALATVFLLAAVGCGDDGTDSADPAEDPPSSTEAPVGGTAPAPASSAPAAPSTSTSEPSVVGTPAWTLISGAGDESSFGLAPIGDAEIVVTGWTSDDLGGPSAGDRDIWLARVGPEPTDTLWELQWGEANRDSPLGIDVGSDDAVFVGGFTDSDLVDANRGKVDGWIGRIEADGTRAWTTQFGGPDWDRVFDVSAADASVYATGYTLGEMAPDGPGGNDGFVAAFDAATGAQQWLTLVGTPEQDWGQGSAVTADGGVVITGYTMGDLAEPNAGARRHVRRPAVARWVRRVDGPDRIGRRGLDPGGRHRPRRRGRRRRRLHRRRADPAARR